MAYFLAVPVFALVYYCFPNDWWNTNDNLSFWDTLYYSTVTITTLGFGDISLVNTTGRITTVTESLWGVFAN